MEGKGNGVVPRKNVGHSIVNNFKSYKSNRKEKRQVEYYIARAKKLTRIPEQTLMVNLILLGYETAREFDDCRELVRREWTLSEEAQQDIRPEDMAAVKAKFLLSKGRELTGLTEQLLMVNLLLAGFEGMTELNGCRNTIKEEWERQESELVIF